jgi:hypothetical protein
MLWLPLLRAHWRAAAGLLRRFNSIISRERPALKVDRHRSCHRPHLHSHHHRHTTMGKKKNDFEASGSGTNKVVGAPEVIN